MYLNCIRPSFVLAHSFFKRMEIDPRTGLWKHPQPYKKPVNQTDEMIEDFIAKCEREAAKLEITVDYYIKEFI